MNIPEKPDHEIWTDDQWRAIHAGGCDILVSAAAGSGKTAVLVERIIRRIINKEVSVDKLLVTTFTEAAAAEMKQRIREKLEEAMIENRDSDLREQLNLLNRAKISTLHSFCSEVVRKYYYLTDIDPAFRIIDSTEDVLLREEAMEQMLEEEYGKADNEAFFRVVDMFASDRDDTGLQDVIEKLYDFARATPEPEKWLNKLSDNYDIDSGKTIDDLPFIEPLVKEIQLQLEEAKRLFEAGYALTQKSGGPFPRAENFTEDLQTVERLINAGKKSFQALYEEIQSVKFSNLKRVSKKDEFDQTYVEQTKDLRDQGKKIIEKIRDDIFFRKPETFLKDLKEMQEPVQTIAGLVKKFAQYYSRIKKEKAVADFSDLEHYTLKILGRYDESGKLVPTEVAREYQDQFKEVYIDEYQDTNSVQEAILQLVKQPTEENGNMFMVGDVKQSIYRFRLAEPELFLDKYRRFTKAGHKSGVRIDLSQNFRSRKEILDAVNFLFKQIMDRNIGEIEYDRDAGLKQGADYPEDDVYPVEAVILHKDEEDSDQRNPVYNREDSGNREDGFSLEELEQSEMEARYVAGKIRKLMDSEKQIFDPKKKAYRPIQYRDIVILLRSFAWAPQFMEALKEFDIPVYAETSEGYFDKPEIETMISLLKVIDNPQQDIPLAGVLRSPIVGLSEEQLARIRVYTKSGSYYEAVKNFLNRDVSDVIEKNAQKKLELFIGRLNDWRTLARQGALSDLIWQLYRDTNFYDYAGGLPGGKQRQANLRALYDRARAYESTSFRGLYRFLRFIDRIKEQKRDLGEARSLGEQEDVVRIMTIHKSKGLEFPVVFVSGLTRKFNTNDLKKEYLFDKDFGFAVQYMNPEKRIRYPSIFHMALKRKKRLEMLAEEMRVLYVALTRAKEKLYLIGSFKEQPEKLLKNWQKHLKNSGWLISNYDRMRAERFFDWIGPALVRHRDGEDLRNGQEEELDANQFKEIFNHPSQWKVQLIPGSAVLKEGEDREKEDLLLNYVQKGKPVPRESDYKEKIRAQLSWKYPYLPATIHRSKQSVSEMKRLWELRDELSGDDFIRPFKKPITMRPKFMQKKKVTPAEKGTSMHMVMQHISLKEKPDKQSIEELLSQLQAKEILTAEEAEVVETEQIVRFFDTRLGERLLQAEWVKREVPFSFSLPAREVYSGWQEGEDRVIIQGIVDCLFKDDEGLVIIDYKTDQIKERFPGGFEQARPVLLNRYETQIQLYRQAVESILKEEVREAYLFFFDGAHILPVDY